MACKLFLGGVSSSTSDDVIRQHFSRFGSVADAVVMRDRGFGFVTFDSQDAANAALAQPQQNIDGQTIDVKTAVGKGGGGGGGGRGGGDRGGGKGGGGGGHGGPTDKVFVGGLPQDCTDDKIRDYFQTYGTIVDAVVMIDRGTGRSRGFGFVQFDNNQSVDRVMTEYASHKVEGKWVEVKRSVPRDQMPASPPDRDDRGRGGGDRGGDRGSDSRCGGGGGGGGGSRPQYDYSSMQPAACGGAYTAGYPGFGGYPGYGAYPGYPGYAGYPGYPGYPQYAGAYGGGAYMMPPPGGGGGMDPYAAAYGSAYGAPPASAPSKGSSAGGRPSPY